MLKTTIPYLQLLLLALLSITSCIPKQGITNARKELSTINQQLKDKDASLANLEKERKKKEQLNQIDDTASSRIKKFIDNTHQQLDTLVRNNTVLIGETALEKKTGTAFAKRWLFPEKRAN